jgi:exonuclease III
LSDDPGQPNFRVTQPILAVNTPNTNISNKPNFQLGLPKLKGFKIASLNIASIIKHIDELRIHMATKYVDILILNETRLDDTIDLAEYHIDGYSIVTKHRNRYGGGVAIYLRNTIDFVIRHDLEHDALEFLTVEVRKPKVKPFLVGTWYRSPNSSIELFGFFETILDKIENENIECTFLGDFNCNISSQNPSQCTNALLELCDLYQFSTH